MAILVLFIFITFQQFPTINMQRDDLWSKGAFYLVHLAWNILPNIVKIAKQVFFHQYYHKSIIKRSLAYNTY